MDDFAPQPAPLRFKDLVRVLRRRAWIAVFTFALVVVVANVLTARITPVYEASTRLLVESPATSVALPTSMMDFLRGGGQTGGNIDLDMAKMRSQAFLKKVVERMGLPNGTPTDYIAGKIVLSSDVGGQIFIISGRGPTPKEAKQLTDALADVYRSEADREFDAKTSLSEARLRKASQEALVEKREAEAAMNAFSARAGLSDPGRYYLNQLDKTITVKNNLADAQKNLPVMQANVAAYQEQLARLSPTVINGFPLNKNALIDQYRNEITELQVKRKELLADYAEDSFEVQEIDQKIAYREKAISGIEANGPFTVGSKSVSRNPDYSNLQTKIFDTQLSIKTTKQNIGVWQKQLVEMEAQQKRLSLLQNQYVTLKREYERANEVYEKTRLGLSAMPQQRITSRPFIEVLDPSKLPSTPISPKPLLNNVLAVALGFLLGVGMALTAELLAGGNFTEADNSHFLPTVGGIPLLATLPAAIPSPLPSHEQSNAELPVPVRQAAVGGAGLEDALREIGYVLAHRPERGPIPVIVLTATRSDDTTAVLAAQLTATLVREGMRVTLVDADRMQPRLNRVFGAPDAPGLSDALARRRAVSDILHVGAEGRLRFLAAGAPDDGVKLTEPALRSVFKQLANPDQTDLVLVSGPSVWSARIVAPLERAASGMVLVAVDGDEGSSAAESVARARRILTNGHAPRIMGVIIGQGAAQNIVVTEPTAALPASAGAEAES